MVGAITSSGCTNCIEICKCRDKGSAVDTIIRLYFEQESNRLKDSEWECVNYGWVQEHHQLSAAAMMQNIGFDQQGQDNTDIIFGNGSDEDVPY